MAQADQPTAEGYCRLNLSGRAFGGHGAEKGHLVQLFPNSKMVQGPIDWGRDRLDFLEGEVILEGAIGEGDGQKRQDRVRV